MKNSYVDYHENIKNELYENWFENKLLPKLEASSVIVLENAASEKPLSAL